jgi:hypothetical protein
VVVVVFFFFFFFASLDFVHCRGFLISPQDKPYDSLDGESENCEASVIHSTVSPWCYQPHSNLQALISRAQATLRPQMNTHTQGHLHFPNVIGRHESSAFQNAATTKIGSCGPKLISFSLRLDCVLCK